MANDRARRPAAGRGAEIGRRRIGHCDDHARARERRGGFEPPRLGIVEHGNGTSAASRQRVALGCGQQMAEHEGVAARRHRGPQRGQPRRVERAVAVQPDHLDAGRGVPFVRGVPEHHEPDAMSAGRARGPVEDDALGAAQRQRGNRGVDLGRRKIEQRWLIGHRGRREQARQRMLDDVVDLR